MRSDLDALAAAALDRWGRIDILAANAGIYPHVPFAELTPDEFDRHIAINVRGAVFAAQACLEPMQRNGYGRIVLTSSITGSVVGPARIHRVRDDQGGDARIHALGGGRGRAARA